MRNSRLLLLAAALIQAAPLAAWEDPFGLGSVSGYVQAWALGRPETGLPRPGALDDSGRDAGGWRNDGLYLRRFEAKLGVPLGFPGLSLALAVQNDLNKAGIGDAYVRWNPPVLGLRVQAGQMRLPFGAEQQTGSAALLALDRALIYGFSNYGHVDNWGLGLLAERGGGVRVDWSPGRPVPAEEPALRFKLEAGAFSTRSQGFYSLLGGGGRASLKAGRAYLSAELGASVFAGRGRPGWQATSYHPLGESGGALAAPVQPWDRPTVLTWGSDADLEADPFHATAELALQRAEGLERGGGQVTAWIDLPLTPAQCQLFGRVEQAYSGWGDGVHRPGSLLRARAIGLRAGLPWRQSLTGERLELSGDDLESGFPGSLWIAQWQAEF